MVCVNKKETANVSIYFFPLQTWKLGQSIQMIEDNHYLGFASNCHKFHVH